MAIVTGPSPGKIALYGLFVRHSLSLWGRGVPAGWKPVLPWLQANPPSLYFLLNSPSREHGHFACAAQAGSLRSRIMGWGEGVCRRGQGAAHPGPLPQISLQNFVKLSCPGEERGVAGPWDSYHPGVFEVRPEGL